MTLKRSRTVATGGVEKRAFGNRALHRPTYLSPTRVSKQELEEPSLSELARVIKAGACIPTVCLLTIPLICCHINGF